MVNKPRLKPGRPCKTGHSQERGVGLIEVLISILVIAIGLLGLAALQGKAQKAEMESYQRSQALILLQDMASRLRANRGERTSYVTTGCAATCSAVPASPTVARDLCEWANGLAGSAEKLGGQSVGAMLGGCGCITKYSSNDNDNDNDDDDDDDNDDDITGSSDEFVVSVAWQGLAAVGTPATDNTCGSGIPNRRVMSIPLRFFETGS